MANPTADLQGDTLSGHSSALIKTKRGVSPTNYAIMQNIGTMTTYLLANGYTAAQLKQMTKNDLVYACKKKLALT